MKTLFNFKNEMLDSLLEGKIKNVVFNNLYQIEDIKTRFDGSNCVSIAFFDYKNLRFEIAVFEKKEENDKLSFNLFVECDKQGIFLPIDKNNIQPSYDSIETLQQIVNKGFESILKDIDTEFKEEINKAKPKIEQNLKYESFVYDFCRENKMVNVMYALGINNYHDFFNKYATKGELQFDKFIYFNRLDDLTYKETYNKLLPHKINELAQIDKANYKERTFEEFITVLNESGFDLKYLNYGELKDANYFKLKEKYNDYKNAINSNIKISKDENDENEVQEKDIQFPQEDNMDEYMDFDDEAEY